LTAHSTYTCSLQPNILHAPSIPNTSEKPTNILSAILATANTNLTICYYSHWLSDMVLVPNTHMSIHEQFYYYYQL